MPVQDKLLTDRAIRHAGPGTHNDGNGLTLRVGKGGRRSWVLRYMFNGKPANVGLGSYPSVGVKEARAKAAECRAEIEEGYKPTGSKERATAKRAAQQAYASKPTFREVAERVIELRRPTWSSERHATQWTESLTNHAFPAIGAMQIERISSGDILGMLSPIWNEIPETATRVKQRAEVVFDYAIASNMRQDNPVSAVAKALPRRPRLKRHHPAVDDYSEVPAVLNLVRNSTADKFTRLAFEFLVLTAARSGEARDMIWDEVWGDTWTVPAERMKKRREHRVPLSDRAVAILKQAKSLRKEGNLVFPSPRTGRPLSDMAFTRMLKRLEIPAVPHGFRSSFKDWTLSETSYPWAVSEAALAHNLGNNLESAYARTDLFERRRGLMQEWATFCGGNVE